MAEKLFPVAPSLNTREHYASKGEFVGASRFVATDDDCSLCLTGCTKDVPVFAYLADNTDSSRNDFRSFIKKIPTNNTIVGTLIYIDPITGIETPYIITDNTYGTFYSLGTLKTNVWGFILDWYKVASLLGFGTYKFNITVSNTVPNVVFDQTSPCFKLRPWSCNAIHGTVRIETTQSGYIESGFDYRGIAAEILLPSGKILVVDGWPQQLRWYGDMFAGVPTIITDNIVTSNRDNEQVQTQIVDNFVLRLFHIQTNLSNHFFKDNLLANKILVNDYTINNPNIFREKRVNPVDISDRKTFRLNKNEIFIVNLEEYNKSTLKRN